MNDIISILKKYCDHGEYEGNLIINNSVVKIKEIDGSYNISLILNNKKYYTKTYDENEFSYKDAIKIYDITKFEEFVNLVVWGRKWL